jgi:O-antigen biosynthesis protein
LNDEQNVLVAKQTEEFARQIIKLYGDKTLWDRLASYSERAIAPYAPEIVKEELHQVLGNLLPTLKTTQKLPN